MHYHSLTLLSIFLLLASDCWAKDITHYVDCGSVEGVVKTVSITPCSQEPCILRKNANSTISIQFVAKASIREGKSVVHAIINGLHVPFSLPNPDLCKFITPSCPIKSGAVYTYSYTLFMKSIYPSIRLNLQWELQDSATNKDLVCIKFPVSVQ